MHQAWSIAEEQSDLSIHSSHLPKAKGLSSDGMRTQYRLVQRSKKMYNIYHKVA